MTAPPFAAWRGSRRRSRSAPCLLALWEAVVRVNGIPPYVLPAPSAIAASLWIDGPSLLARCS